MSREHFYKAKRVNWRKLPKEIWWVEGDLIHEPYGTVIQYYEDEINDKGNCTKTSKKKRIKVIVNPKTVCEYTGLTDKSKRNIFEGDICEFSVFDYNGSDTQYKGVVVYTGSRFMLWKSKESEYYGNDGGFDLDWTISQDDEIEVIGNIFDNPELLEGDATE